MSDLPDLYFAHIPKTAGTSVAEVLRKAYGCDAIVPAYTWNELRRLPMRSLRQHRCWVGHLGPLPYAMSARPLMAFTILRDPVERAVSHVEYVKQEILGKTGNCQGHPVAQHVDKPLEALLEIPSVRKSLSNAQTAWLGARVDRATVRWGIPADFPRRLHTQLRRAGDEVLLARAKEHLDALAVVGTVDRMDESIAAICTLLGVEPPERAPRANVGPRSRSGLSHRERIGPELAARLDALNEQDHALLAYAKAHFGLKANPQPVCLSCPAGAMPSRLSTWMELVRRRLRR